MDTQEDVFLNGEGDRWFERNVLKMEQNADHDPVIAKIMEGNLKPYNILEFGCSNGWRLQRLKDLYHSQRMNVGCYGFDPSAAAIANGNLRFPGLHLRRGTATTFEAVSNSIDVLIYGFCLYVCDPEDLFEIATQGNRILTVGGIIVIHDFDPEYPHAVPNHHVSGLKTYKMDYSKMWLAHPGYRMLSKSALPDGTAITVLGKSSTDDAFPLIERELSC